MNDETNAIAEHYPAPSRAPKFGLRLVFVMLLALAVPGNILFRSLLENPLAWPSLSPARQFLYGCLYAQPLLLALWAVLGPGRWSAQWLPSAILVAGLSGANVAASAHANNGILYYEWAWTEPFDWFLVFLVPQIPLCYLRRRRRWRMTLARADGSSVERRAQFTLSSLMLAVALLAGALAAARHLTPFKGAWWRFGEEVPLLSILDSYCWEAAWLSVVGCAWIAWAGALLGELAVWKGGAISLALVILATSAVVAIEAAHWTLPFWLGMKHLAPLIFRPSLGMGTVVTLAALLARFGGWRFNRSSSMPAF